MFDRFIRLSRARKALREGRLEEALQFAADPWIADDRRAEEVRGAARERLLERAQKRLHDGDPAGAERDLQRLVRFGKAPEVDACLKSVRERLAERDQQRLAGQRCLDEARRLAEQGHCDAALAAAAPGRQSDHLAAGLRALDAFVGARRERAAAQLQRAEGLARQGQVDAAILELQAARALDQGTPSAPWIGALVERAATQLTDEVGSDLAAGTGLAALRRYRARLLELPELAALPAVVAAGERLARTLFDRLAAAGERADVALLQACASMPPLPGAGPQLAAAAAALLRLSSLRNQGRTAELAAALATAAELLDSKELAGAAQEQGERARMVGERLAGARARAAAGDLQLARSELTAVLSESPMHEEARAELEAIERGLREREQRLEAARQASRAGRLREAYGLLLADALPGPAGDEARLFGQELRARIDLVGRGLDQVRAAAHGRESGSAEGLRHCLLRLEELAKVQVDHEELPVLRAALAAELGALDKVAAARTALHERRFQDAGAAVGELVAARGSLLTADRLDARILELVDGLATAADAALAGGRLAAVEACLVGMGAAAEVRLELGASVARLQQAAAGQRERADALAAEADGLLRQKDLAGSEQRCEAALQLWVDCPPARRLEEQLRQIREHEAALTRADSMRRGGDLEGAEQTLGAMPPTPALLRTRIFDMKQSLARAQGLEGAFVLRVDEGGEWLVLRGESVSIGNLRDARADLPILAAIAGRHARIQRSMSFHGGMQDTVVAEDGEVQVAGKAVRNHRLSSGDRLRLGSALQLAYGVPSSRSLTACLQLLGGFQVAGTDRVLLLKDRGRDGRILLGAGGDVHVRVPSATSEVEVFAHKTGQVRVRCEAGGTIDGRPFKGEHPVDAGAVVQAAGVQFVLLPFRKPG